MSGRRGRSGGQNRIDPALHVLRGSFRPARHARPPVVAPPVWTPTADQLARLGADGQALVARVTDAFTVGLVEGPLLLEAAHASDRLAELRLARATNADLAHRLRLGRAEALWQRQLSALLQVLRVDR